MDRLDEEGGDKLPETSARALRDAVRGLILAHGALDNIKRPCGTALSTPHAWALLELTNQQEMTVTELASRLNIDRTNVSRLCQRMVENGELARSAHPEDKRVRLISLTEKGKSLAETVDDASAKHFESILSQLGERSPQVFEALEALIQALRRDETTSD